MEVRGAQGDVKIMAVAEATAVQNSPSLIG